MGRREGSTPLELLPEDSDELKQLCGERNYKRMQLGHILLRFAMLRVDEAISEWNQEGAHRTQRRRNTIPLDAERRRKR